MFSYLEAKNKGGASIREAVQFECIRYFITDKEGGKLSPQVCNVMKFVHSLREVVLLIDSFRFV